MTIRIFQILFCLMIVITGLKANAVENSYIEDRINALIASHEELNKYIHYEVNQGVVILQGEVKTHDDKAFAERIATNIPGVYRVRNLLVIDLDKKRFSF